MYQVSQSCVCDPLPFLFCTKRFSPRPGIVHSLPLFHFMHCFCKTASCTLENTVLSAPLHASCTAPCTTLSTSSSSELYRNSELSTSVSAQRRNTQHPPTSRTSPISTGSRTTLRSGRESWIWGLCGHSKCHVPHHDQSVLLLYPDGERKFCSTLRNLPRCGFVGGRGPVRVQRMVTQRIDVLPGVL